MEKLKRLSDILYAFDTYDVFEFYKLTGASALQFLIFEIGFLTDTLNFDLDTDLEISKVNEIRSLVNQLLPTLLQKKNFTIDLKQLKLTGRMDTYVIIDNQNKMNFKLNFNYVNRVHILNPEYFARKDNLFEDLHIYALSNLENYARHIIEILENTYDYKILDFLLSNNKIRPQQYPFLRKLVAFYISISDLRQHFSVDILNHKLQDILKFNADELKYLDYVKKGIYDLSLILPSTMQTKMEQHPLVKHLRQSS